MTGPDLARAPESSPKADGAAKIFTCSAAVFLLLTVLAKFWSVTASSVPLTTLDPVLQVEHRIALLGTALIELSVATCLLIARDRAWTHLLLLWLSANFILYRAALWWVQPGEPCPCLGSLALRLPLKWTIVEAGLKVVLTYLFLGSLFFIIWPSAAAVIGRLGPRARSNLKRTVLLGGILLLLPPIQVGCVALVHPPTTGPMLLCGLAKRLAEESRLPNRYTWRDLQTVPVMFQRAVVVAEDRHFFEHHGFDWRRIKFAIQEAAIRNKPPRGASTITQQCARSLFLWQGRSWIRKGLEAYYTVWMELLLNKRRILELYVNIIELGDGIYGIEAAAQHYYGKAAKDLTREEAAMLAVILPAPKRWNPLQPNELVVRRQQIILSQMDQVRLPWESSAETALTRASTNTVNMAEPQPAQTHENGPPTDVQTATAP